MVKEKNPTYTWELEPHITRRGKSLRRRRRALYRCSCGRDFIASVEAVSSGHTRSCGCLRKKAKSWNGHGFSSHPIYARWKLLKGRCYNKNADNYRFYGGRGVTMCSLWKKNFRAFYDYVLALPDATKSGYVLDSDGNYEPGSMSWQPAEKRAVDRMKKRLQNK